ncbi:MAG: segregation/condensation protein A [Elusimicrobiaceae bacterium]|nr:segregation/condensation protein A [Elusimicrobiaceae bacterium]
MLNIPAMDVHIDIFEGPMDLLLHLIRKNNLDIYDIPIAQITREYLDYIEAIKELNLEVAGEFLVMATTLMQIKTQMLLPSQAAPGEEEGPDPKADLIQKLADYQKFKEASRFLNDRFEVFKDVYYRGSPVFSDSDKVLNLEMVELMEAVKRAFTRIGTEADRIISGETFPIEKRMDRILNMLRAREWILFDDAFAPETHKMGVITCFMALLELMKLKKLITRQDELFGEIRVYRRPVEDAAREEAEQRAWAEQHNAQERAARQEPGAPSPDQAGGAGQ